MKQKKQTNEKDDHPKKNRRWKKMKVSENAHAGATNFPSDSSEFSSNWKLFLESRKTKENPASIHNPDRNIRNKKMTFSKTKKGRKKSLSEGRDLKGVENLDQKVESNKIWFDGVDPRLIEKECGLKFPSSRAVKTPDEKLTVEAESISSNVTRYVALDCEMVGVGPDGKDNALARVSLVNSLGECIYDKYVKPMEGVVDYRTDVSGIRPDDLKDAPCYETVQREVYDLLNGRILVGHALHNDLKVLMLSHSRRQIRDTAKYKPFKKLLKTKRPALRKLAAQILNKQIQCGEHSSVIDARVTMEIFQKYKKEWESSLRTRQDSKAPEKKLVFMGVSSANKTKRLNKWKRKRNKLREE